jgi:hypothetical protein
MSTTEISETCTAIRTDLPEQFLESAVGQSRGGNCTSQAFIDPSDRGILDRFGEQARLTGIAIGSDEADEFRVFDEFLTRHVQPNRICDVQCMLLWSEWVRAFRRQTRAFPSLIRENEFRSVIMEMFGVGISNDNIRGSVYPGLRFVP